LLGTPSELCDLCFPFCPEVSDEPGRTSTRRLTMSQTTHQGFASYFSQTVLGVLFGLTLRAGLDHGAAPLLDAIDWPSLWADMQAHPARYWFAFLQLTAFILTLCRFYAGAYRFHQAQPPDAPLKLLLFDATWTLFLFVSFYVAALLVTKHDLFWLAITLMHIVDFVWFLLGGVIGSPPRHIQKVITLYLAYDAATVVLLGVSWGAVAHYSLDSIHLQWMTAAILLLMFVIDGMWITRDWYFNPEAWKAAHGDPT
jgi:hypothetical protein